MPPYREPFDSDELRYYCRECEACYPERVYRAGGGLCLLHAWQPLVDTATRPEAVGPITPPLEHCARPSIDLNQILLAALFFAFLGLLYLCYPNASPDQPPFRNPLDWLSL